MASGVSRDTVFEEIRPGAGFETADFVTEKCVGGATVERLVTAVNISRVSLKNLLPDRRETTKACFGCGLRQSLASYDDCNGLCPGNLLREAMTSVALFEAPLISG